MEIEDSLFARYGGDEFVIVQYNLQEKHQIKSILDNIIKKLSNPIIINDKIITYFHEYMTCKNMLDKYL